MLASIRRRRRWLRRWVSPSSCDGVASRRTQQQRAPSGGGGGGSAHSAFVEKRSWKEWKNCTVWFLEKKTKSVGEVLTLTHLPLKEVVTVQRREERRRGGESHARHAAPLPEDGAAAGGGHPEMHLHHVVSREREPPKKCFFWMRFELAHLGVPPSGASRRTASPIHIVEGSFSAVCGPPHEPLRHSSTCPFHPLDEAARALRYNDAAPRASSTSFFSRLTKQPRRKIKYPPPSPHHTPNNHAGIWGPSASDAHPPPATHILNTPSLPPNPPSPPLPPTVPRRDRTHKNTTTKTKHTCQQRTMDASQQEPELEAHGGGDHGPRGAAVRRQRQGELHKLIIQLRPTA